MQSLTYQQPDWVAVLATQAIRRSVRAVPGYLFETKMIDWGKGALKDVSFRDTEPWQRIWYSRLKESSGIM
jgi:hypothetical protein